jgi:hypothetical protein
MTVLGRLAVATAALLSSCAPASGSAAAPASLRTPERASAPTTRLVQPQEHAARDLDCADFARRADAEAALRADPRDPHGLDADRDGVACEHLR